MKKQLGVLAGLALAVASSAAFAAPEGTIGVGVAHTNANLQDGNLIFVPITLGQGLWMEPFAAYSHFDADNGGTDATQLTVGAGLFQDVFTTAKTKAYVGGRLGYTYVDFSGPNNNDDGVIVQPVLGFGYLPVDNVMFGAEAFATYTDANGGSFGGTNGKSYGTGTDLFVRYFFAR